MHVRTDASSSSDLDATRPLGRLLHVEDDPLVRRAIAFAFAEYRIDGVSTIAHARARMTKERYLAWVVDVHLPDGSGLELLRWARDAGLGTPALVVTADEARSVVSDTQILGVELAYKPELRANLRAFLARAHGAGAVAPVVEAAADRFADQHRLSRRERDLVHAIARGVARRSLGDELGVTENTVKTMIRRMLRKTGITGLEEVLRAVLGRAPR